MSDSTSICDPAARSHTALFVLLGRLLSGVINKNTRRVDFPVNRSGQNSVECYTLAGLAFFLVTGFFVATAGDILGSQIWSFVVAVPIGLLFTFVAMHLLFFGCAYLYRCMNSIYLFSPNAPKQLPVEVYLVLFTFFAVGIVTTGDPVLIAVAIPWLIWSVANFLAGIILFAGIFFSQLSGKSE